MRTSLNPVPAEVERIFAKCGLYRHQIHRDPRGSLVAIEELADVPFTIARVYYLFGTAAGEARGFHAHRRLDQWAICVAGACTIKVDDGSATHDVRLDSPNLGLRIGPMVWHEMRDFSPDCVLMVLAAAPFDETDYVRDYGEFRRLASATHSA